jgi:hypothetical protein
VQTRQIKGYFGRAPAPAPSTASAGILPNGEKKLLQQLLLESYQMGKEGEVAPPKYVRTVRVALPTGWWSTL